MDKTVYDLSFDNNRKSKEINIIPDIREQVEKSVKT